MRQYNEGHTDCNLNILVKAIEWDRELLDQPCWPSIINVGQQDLQGMFDFQAWANEKGLLDTIATEEQMWDSSFVDYANESLP